MKILLYLVKLHQPQMESHSFPLMLNTLPTDERRRDAKEIENEGVMVVAIGTGTGTGIGIVVIVIATESLMTIITTRNQGGGSMNATTITSIEDMISIPNLDGMKMNIVLGIVIVMSAIGIGNSDQINTPETGNPDQTGKGTKTETEEGKTEETGRGKGNETGRGETKTETEKGNEETGTERKTERDLINHIPHHLMKALHLLHQQVVILLDPSSKKCSLLTLAAIVLYLNIQKQTQELDPSLVFSMTD